MEKENFSLEEIKTNNAANAEQHEQHEQHATQTCLKEQDEKKTCSSDTAAASTTTPLSSSLSRIIMTSNQETDIIKKVAMSEEIPTSNSSLTTSNTFTTSTTSCITASTTTPTTSFTVTSALISATSTPTAAAPPTTIYTTTTTATAIPQVLVISSQSIENDTNGIASATAADADQFVTPQKSTFTMPNKQASTSLKKKRNKSSKCLQLNVSSSSCSSSSNNNNNNHTVAAATHEAQNVGGSSNVGNIKTSLSMTSLPPNEKQDGNDKIKAKLNMERPYNSLKKNTDRNLTNQLATMHASYSTNSNNNSNKKLHRYSWGSGHSSSSLHSSAATLGIGSGKDDFWAAIQTNYNYIMDTNLLDTCKEARCEIEGASCGVLDNKMDKCFKMLDDHHRAEGSCEDPKELRKWLREMEHKLENAPTLSEATMLTCAELEKYLNEHSVLYHEIVSHARVVSACIRVATEKEQQLKLQQQQLLEQQQQQQQQQLQQQQQQLELNNEDFLNQNNSSSCTTLSIQETLLNLAEQNNSSLSSTDETIATTSATNTEPAETTDNSASLPTTSSSSGIVCSTESKSKSSLNLATSPSNSCTTQASSSSRKSENNLERLQNRYHLLYLKAFEVQLWLDGLLRKKSSSVGNLTNEDLDSEYIDDSHDLSSDDDDDDDIDDIDEIDNVDNSNDIHGEGATEDDLNDVASDLESDITNNSVSSSAFGNDDGNNPATKQPQKQQHHHQLSDILHIDIDDHQQQQQSLNVSSSSSTTAAANLQQHQQQKPAHIQAAAANSARDCIQTKIDCEDGDDEQEDYENYEEDNDYDDDDDEEALENYSEDVIDSSPNYRKQLGYTKLLVTFDRRRLSHTPHANAARELTLTDFEADSESSDLEIIQKQQQRYKASCLQQLPYGLLRNSKYHSYSNLNSKNNYRQLSKTTTTALKAFIIDNTTAGCSNTTTDLDCGRLNQAKTAAASLGGSICDMQTVANALVNGQQNQYSLNCAALVQPNDAMTAGSPTNLASSSSITAAARATAASATDLHSHSGDSSSGGSSSSNSSRSITGNSSSNSNSTSNFNSMETTVNIGNSHSFNSHIMLEKLTANENNHLHQQQQQHQQHLLNAANNGKAVAAGVAGTAAGGGGAMKHKNIAIISPNNRNNSNNGVGAGKHHHHHHHQQPNKSSSLPSHKSPTVLRKHHGEHFSITDVSKFNRSNRKSKHCATFYFKHLDTDNETNYSTSNCGGECCSGTNEDDDYNLNNSKTGNRTLTDVRRSGIMSSSADSSDLLKSAEVSSDDEGWLYTSSTTATAAISPPPHNHRQQHLSIGGGIESLNSNHNFRQQTISSNEIRFIAQQSEATAAIQSPTVSSSTPASTLQQAVAVSASAISAIIGDDSDKENKEAKATTTTTTVGTAAAATSSIRINLSQATQYVASTTVIGSNSCTGGIVATSRIAAANGGSSSSSSITSSSYSSNELMTEATATTSESAKTQILNNSHHQQQQHSMNRSYRSEMELQINGNKKLHSHSGSSNNNNNNNCANSAQQQKLIMSSNQYSSSMQLDSPTQSSAPYNGLEDANGNLEKENINFYTRADIRNISVKPNDNLHYQQQQQQHNAVVSISPASMMYAQQLHVGNVGKRLPPRSPAKSIISHCSTTTSSSTISPSKGKVSHESIKQLVLEAENLVRDEALKTPSKQQKHSKGGGSSSNTLALNSHSGGGVNCGNIVQISATIKKREIAMPGPIKERVQEWLEHQPTTPVSMQRSISHNAHHHHHQHQHQHHNNHHHANQSDLPLSPTTNAIPPVPIRADDCEASGEASETDSVPQHCSDTSEGLTDSIATCMQTSTNSYGNSTERMGGSAEPIATKGNSNQSLNVKVVRRQQSRRKSERPWSVSCLSQLTTDVQQKSTKVTNIADVQAGLASHSISESALDSLSPGRPRASSSSAATQVKSYDSKGSLKRRKTRKKKLSYSNVVANGKKSDSNSEDYQQQQQQHHAAATAQDMANKVNYTQSVLLQSYDNMTPQQIQEITQALMQLQNAEQQQIVGAAGAEHTGSTDENSHLMKPNFRVGAFTTAYMASETKLGSLAALATYMNEDGEQQGEYTTGTEDHHSSFSETAWDNYQEKYNSENYSEGFDSDAARKLLEFGDDYRNFIDSQSDCCSSLSAANNLDSFSPPRMDSLQQNEAKIITQDTIVSSVDHARRRRALELEYERRRKNLEIRRKSCQESLEYHNPNKSPAVQALSASTQALTPKNSQTERFNFQNKLENNTASNIHRKLEFGIGMSHSAQSLRRTSESDTSQRRRKADERRRSSRNLEKCIKLIPATTSSSSENDSDGEREIRNLLQQSHNRLEDTKALKIRCHLLRPEDYTEIINTCRDNIRCLESVLKGPSSSVLSSQCISQSKDLLSAWEDLLGWSENAAAARKMQEEMILLKHSLNRLGNKSSFELLDTEPSIQIAIEALKNEKTQLQTYRTSMLKLNASVHSWLTRQERRLQNALVEQQLKAAAVNLSQELLEEKEETESEQQAAQQTEAAAAASTTKQTTMITVTDSNGNQVETHTATTTSTSSVATQSANLNEKSWDLQTLMSSENEFHKHLKNEVSDMYMAWDEADARINSQLEVLTSSLIAWRQLECGLSEFQQALGQDRGTLKGLEGALSTGQATPGEMAQNVKLVAKLLSEKVNVSQEQLTAVQDYLDPNHVLHIHKFTASNGSLSDSGISDGGTTSDGGLSERERRLGVLRRLAKQLESALAPGSEAMKSIAARMESAEVELKSLQNTCRDLIVRTAASHQNKKQQQELERQQLQQQQQQHKDAELLANGIKINQNGGLKTNGHIVMLENGNGIYDAADNKRNKRRPRRSISASSNQNNAAADMSQVNAAEIKSLMTANGDDGDDPSDDPLGKYEFDSSDDDDEQTPKAKRGWAWRIARVAVPMQLALFTVYCAACMMQPNCCDNLNNFSMSFAPQLRYIRGPPPI